MKVLYKAGRNMSWSGVCEYDTQTRRYVHHEKWPTRTTPYYGDSTIANNPENYVKDGFWEHYEPYLQLQEGL